ncbi:MAG: cation:proton antiporter, partial [Halorubrum sp.]
AHDAKPLVDFPLGGESRSTLAASDGGRAADDAATDGGRAADDAATDGSRPDDDGDDDPADDEPDVDDVVERAEGDSATEEADASAVDADATDDSDIPDAELDDLPTDEAGVVRPDFAASERDFSEPAERVDTGDYAVDTRPSDADVPFGPGRSEGEGTDAEPDDGGDDHGHDGGDDHGHDGGDDHGHVTDDDHGHVTDDDHGHDAGDDHGHDHAGGPPAGGWRHIDGLDALRGRESSWFTLGPILTAMSLAVLLGVIPYEMGFLELIELIVDTRLPEGVMRP